MNLDQKMAAFQAVAQALMDDTKKTGLFFHILVLKDKGYRVMLEYNKTKQGWTMDARTTLRDFEKEFSRRLSDILKNKPTSLFGL